MKKIYVLLFWVHLVLFLMPMGDVHAQNIKVTGKVVSTDGKPLELVTVKVKGSGETTATNAAGLFNRNAKKSFILQFTSVGFKLSELPATSALMMVYLEQMTDSLDQVVVVGYRRQKKVNLTGAVSVVSGTLPQNEDKKKAVNQSYC